MFASRYLSVWMHAIAETLGVRVLIVDRYDSCNADPQSRLADGTRLLPGQGWVTQPMYRLSSESLFGLKWCLPFWRICR